MTDTTPEPSGAQRMFGDFAPALVSYTDDVLFGDAWKRAGLSPRDRSRLREADAADDLPKHHYFTSSQFAVTGMVLRMIRRS